MTVIHFETESDNATLQENIKSIAHTLSRALAAPARVVYTQPAQIGSGDGAGEAVEAELEDDAIDAELAPSAPKKKSGTARQFRTPKPVDIDLTSGDTPLKAFLEEKDPDGDIKRYLAITYWLKKYRDIEEVSADHIYTGYRHMGSGWQVPADSAAPFRYMKRKQYGWIKGGSKNGLYIINHLGENVIEGMGKE